MSSTTNKSFILLNNETNQAILFYYCGNYQPDFLVKYDALFGGRKSTMTMFMLVKDYKYYLFDPAVSDIQLMISTHGSFFDHVHIVFISDDRRASSIFGMSEFSTGTEVIEVDSTFVSTSYTFTIYIQSRKGFDPHLLQLLGDRIEVRSQPKEQRNDQIKKVLTSKVLDVTPTPIVINQPELVNVEEDDAYHSSNTKNISYDGVTQHIKSHDHTVNELSDIILYILSLTNGSYPDCETCQYYYDFIKNDDTNLSDNFSTFAGIKLTEIHHTIAQKKYGSIMPTVISDTGHSLNPFFMENNQIKVPFLSLFKTRFNKQYYIILSDGSLPIWNMSYADCDLRLAPLTLMSFPDYLKFVFRGADSSTVIDSLARFMA